MTDRVIEKIVHDKVMAETNHRCAYCNERHGRLGEAIEVHHIGGRNNITRFDARGQIGLCDWDHKFNPEISPHNKNPKAFYRWLRKNRPNKYRFYMRNRNRIVQDRDVDLKKVRRKLKVA